ncbi:dUTP diphosphatase [Actinomycetospora aeridis]|uniref:Deoxyuridine 5'-triphosphate nucleotidohydrolase n=1 Tax=Actinomycetospora aeridis TaxID=3129231 RepID=A0ABU8NE17_9PSEU
MSEAVVQVDLVRLDAGLPVPARARPGDAGADLAASGDVTLAPGERALVGTGVAVVLPEGYAAFVMPRSGLAVREGIGLLNSPGTVDAGYRGEIQVCLINHDPARTATIRRGDRVAQLVVQRVEETEFRVLEGVDDLETLATVAPSARGAGGFGSTGVAAPDGTPDRQPEGQGEQS